jgi:hypothetical protein
MLKLALVWFLFCLGCTTPPSAPPITSFVGVQIQPESLYESQHGDYSLRYVQEVDGGVGTRYVGPSCALSAGLNIKRTEQDGWQKLVAWVPGWDWEAAIARWRMNHQGQISDVWVQTGPILEIRPLDLRPGQIVADVEWRPLQNGIGVGDWRRRPKIGVPE